MDEAVAATRSSSSSSKPTAGAAEVQLAPATSSSAQNSGGSSSAAPGTAWVDLALLKKLAPADDESVLLPLQQQPTAAATGTATAAAAVSAAVKPSQQQQQQSAAAATAPIGVPSDYFGSAAWSIHVRSCNADGIAAEDPSWQLPVAWHASLNSVEWQLMCTDAVLLAKSLAEGAVRIRGALQAVRSDSKFPAKMLQQVQDCCEAGVASQLAMAAGLVHRLDAFVTSWQFGIFDIAFGSSSSSSSREGQKPLAFQGLVHPVPPYHAVVLPAPSPAAAAAAAAAAAGFDAVAGDGAAAVGGGGVWCCLTVPQCLVGLMKESPVLQLLAPGARWLSPDA
jgi:hypothetical protein